MSNFVLSAFADEIDDQLTTQMDVLDRYNIKYIEIRGVNGKNISEYSLPEVGNIKKQLDARGVKISAVGSPIGKMLITDDFAPHFKLFQHVLDIAETLETKHVRIFSFYIPQGQKPEQYRNSVIERLKEMVTSAQARGITLLHENEKDIFGDIPERCLDILESVNSQFLKATFDPANFIQCNVEPFPAAYTILKNHIKYIHIKDALFNDHSVVPAGYGDGKIKDILKELKACGFKGFLSLEPHLASFTGLENLELHSKTPMESKNNGVHKFSLAVNALNAILKEIDADL